VVQVHVVIDGVDGVPTERLVADGDSVAIPRDHRELIREVLLLDDGLYGAVCELAGDANGLEDKPALQKAGRIRRLRRGHRTHERRRGGARRNWCRRRLLRRRAEEEGRSDDDDRGPDHHGVFNTQR
jgi:hypothetical protein